MKKLILSLVSILLITGCAKSPVKAGILSDFEDKKVWDISPEQGFTLTLSKENVSEGNHSLKVIYPISKYPSINTKKLNHKWGKYDYFCFDVFNPQDQRLSFVVRLDDNKRKKVNIDYPLEHGWNHVRIPREQIAKKINPDNISFVVLFLNKPSEKTVLYFDNMHLESGKVATGQKETHKSVEEETRNSIEKETFSPIVIKPAMPVEGQIEIQIAKLANPVKEKVLVSNGIPFAPGQIFSEKNILILNDEDVEIPIATKVLARWPYDNSIRSLLVQFNLDIPHRYKKVILRWGIPRSTEDIALTDVDWELPEGLALLPAEWLCLSDVIGDQIPVRKNPFPPYDYNVKTYYPRMRDAPLVGDPREDDYYDTPHVFYQLYLRAGDDDYFRSARKEALLYRDQIIQTGPERGMNHYYKQTRYIYVEAMIDDYLLTGDQKSLTVAGYMAEYLKNKYDPAQAFFSRDSTRFWTEREAAFPFLGIISYYELTGDKEYLLAAQQIMQNLYRTQNEWPGKGGFIHNLYSHDPEEGAGRDEYGGSPFMTGLLLEAIVKYHQLTNSNIAKDSIYMALDWLMKEGLASDGNSVLYMTRKGLTEGSPDLNMLVVHAFGYGYKISGYERKDYLEVGRRLFENGVKEACLSDRKHFNQNYRSSGHFLAYINEHTDD